MNKKLLIFTSLFFLLLVFSYSQNEDYEASLLNKCINFYNEKMYSKADLLLDTVIKNFPSSYRAYYLKFKIKEISGADDGLYYLKKSIMLYKASNEKKEIKVPDMNQSFFKDINNYLNSNSLSYKFYLKANENLKNGNWVKAIDNLEEAIKTKKRSEYFFKLGDVYVDMGEKHTAIKYYKDGLVLEPENCKTRIKLVELYKEFGDMNSAYFQAKRLMNINPDNLLIKKMYEKLSKRINKNNFQPKVNEISDFLKVPVIKFNNRTVYLKYNGNFQEKIKDFVFKKHKVYDKITGEVVGTVLISSVNKNGVFKGIILKANDNFSIGDYIE